MDSDRNAATTKGTEHLALTGMRSTRYGIALNIVLAAVKATAGVVGNSYALIADAVESLTDIATSGVVYYGLRVSSRPPDEDHPYGHGKAEPLATAVVSAALFLAALGISIQSIREIITPHYAPAPFTLLVLVVVMTVKEGLFRYQRRVARQVGSGAVYSDAWHHRSDAITSLAVFVGISIALVGGKGWESADDWSALFAAFLISINAWLLLRPALLELTDAVPANPLLPKAHDAALALEGVKGIEKCIVRKTGFNLYVDLHLLVDGGLTVTEGHLLAHQVKDTIREADPRVADVLVHVEPSDRILSLAHDSVRMAEL